MDKIKKETNWRLDMKKEKRNSTKHPIHHHKKNWWSKLKKDKRMQAYHFISKEKGLLKCEQKRNGRKELAGD